MKKFKVTVKMKKPWTAKFSTKPNMDNVLEAFADEVLSTEIDNYFEVKIEEVSRVH